MNASCVDCVTELLAYTYHLADQLRMQSLDFDTVAANYQQLIDRAKAEAQSAGIPKAVFEKALFPVFAWIDETILGTGWDRQHEWIKNSLQKKYFNTTNAGTQFFERVEKISEDEKDILEVYDYCLASGFKGSLYHSGQQEKLEQIKKEVKKKINRPENEQIPDILFPDAGDIIFGKRLKRKRWKGLADFASVFVLLPVLLFLVLYYVFDSRLTQIISGLGLLN